jgi:hypothetical protein
MRNIIIILSVLLSFKANSQAVINMNDTMYTLPLISLPLSSCTCNAAKYTWGNVSGNPVIFAMTNTSSTVISGFKAGTSKISLTTLDLKGRTWADTLTLKFIAPIPPPPPPPKPFIVRMTDTKMFIYSDSSRSTIIQNFP